MGILSTLSTLNQQSQFAPVVDGQSSNEGIAKAFQDSFQKNAKPNDPEKVADLDNRFVHEYCQFNETHEENCDCADFTVSVETTIEALSNLKPGKSADDDGLQAEHFLNAPFLLVIKLTSLFNYMLSHAFVPKQFRFGTIIPIIKDRQGSKSDIGNYRGITISPLPSKVFEHVLKVIFSRYLTTSSYQYGFKSKSSTTHALFSLRETINYYIDHGSRVYCSFLDASKAFDRLVHSGLFIKLIDKKVPKRFLDILVTWYEGLQCRVKWDGYLGDWFHMSAGVRQGGVLSPNLYSIYVDNLINILKSSGVGCYISHVFAAALFYADDILIMAPSIRGLQKLLNICSSYCKEWDIGLNPKKSKNMSFGRKLEISSKTTTDTLEIK